MKHAKTSHFFITGASSGIGAALVRKLTTDGHVVTGVARRQNKLNELGHKIPQFFPIKSDVTKTSEMCKAVEKAVKKNGEIDIAILNAGFYKPQNGLKIDPCIFRRHMETNYLGVINALSPIIDRMHSRRSGHIAIVSSVAGWRGLPKSAAYGPTKAALISLSESLYFDLKPAGIKLQIICPGFVESEATSVNDFKMPNLISAEAAADFITAGLEQNLFCIDFPKTFTRQIYLLRWLPYKLYFYIVGRQTGAL